MNQLLGPARGEPAPERAPGGDRGRAARGLGRERLRQRGDRLRDRALAPVRQERSSSAPRWTGGRSNGACSQREPPVLPELETEAPDPSPRAPRHANGHGAFPRGELSRPPRPLVAPAGSGVLHPEAFWSERLAISVEEFQADRAVRFVLQAAASDAIIGTCNYTNIVRGAFHACHLGYQIARAHEGRGLMAEALRGPTSSMFDAMRMHRIAANYRLEKCAQRARAGAAGIRARGTREGLSLHRRRVARPRADLPHPPRLRRRGWLCRAAASSLALSHRPPPQSASSNATSDWRVVGWKVISLHSRWKRPNNPRGFLAAEVENAVAVAAEPLHLALHVSAPRQWSRSLPGYRDCALAAPRSPPMRASAPDPRPRGRAARSSPHACRGPRGGGSPLSHPSAGRAARRRGCSRPRARRDRRTAPPRAD